MTIVHVGLLKEGTHAWRPVEACHVRGSTYELTGVVPDGEAWQFQPGESVECVPHVFQGGEQGLVATRSLPPCGDASHPTQPIARTACPSSPKAAS